MSSAIFQEGTDWEIGVEILQTEVDPPTFL
jgi:hypothetical protein